MTTFFVTLYKSFRGEREKHPYMNRVRIRRESFDDVKEYMVLADSFYTVEDILENTDLEFRAKRIKYDPKYVTTIGSKVALGYSLASTVEDVVYDYEHEYIFVICK